MKPWVAALAAATLFITPMAAGVGYLMANASDAHRPKPINMRWLHFENRGPVVGLWHEGMLSWVRFDIPPEMAMTNWCITADPDFHGLFHVEVWTRNLSEGEQRK